MTSFYSYIVLSPTGHLSDKSKPFFEMFFQKHNNPRLIKHRWFMSSMIISRSLLQSSLLSCSFTHRTLLRQKMHFWMNVFTKKQEPGDCRILYHVLLVYFSCPFIPRPFVFLQIGHLPHPCLRLPTDIIHSLPHIGHFHQTRLLLPEVTSVGSSG